MLRHNLNQSRFGISAKLALLVCAASMMGSTAHAVKVTEMQSRPLDGIPGKEGGMILVEYAPGDVDPIHRHEASVFICVLEGTIIIR